MFVVNRFLISGSRLTLRDRRSPSSDSISQSISRFFFKARAINNALAKAVPAVSGVIV
jgi:hypothetical protein